VVARSDRVCAFAYSLNLSIIGRAFHDCRPGALRILCCGPAQWSRYLELLDSVRAEFVRIEFASIRAFLKDTLPSSVVEAWEFDGAGARLLCTVSDLAIPNAFREDADVQESR
jgi:hypothetical protein